MAKRHQWLWKAIVPPMLGALMFGLVWSHWPLGSSFQAGKKGASERTTPVSAAGRPLAGTASCSARGCHGAIEPVLNPAQCRQNEYNLWADDRHADAYRALFNDRSRDIARLLGGSKKAHEDPRCLACHTNPRLAFVAEDASFVHEERLFGVGCESCHGSASSWLVAHTAADWRVKKRAYEMPDLTDPALQARTCAGCHVGAASDKEAPLRDVNHDLIAAGHPRLNFEFGAYQANMPAHWRPRQKSEAHLWAVGQMVSARAALELLRHRAKSGTWPEFAEYDCFACHHSLAQPSYRQQADRRAGKPGTLAWGSWYFALTREVAGELPALDGLERKMQVLAPNRQEAAAKAKDALDELKKHQLAGVKNGQDEPVVRKRILERLRNGKLSVTPGWDSSEQLYLALHALEPSQALNVLTTERAFPSGFGGPLSWPRDGRPPFEPNRFLEKLKAYQKKN
jgi:hypothetical protein